MSQPEVFKPIVLRALLAAMASLAAALMLSQVARGQASSDSPQSIRRAHHPFPLTKFYDTENVTPSKPGDLIRSEQFDEYDLPIEVLAVRILYHSRSANGHDVPVSGVVLYPDEKPPAGGWPVIAWAHALSGIARQCAPSLARNIQQGPFLSMYVKLGYAVVATDYAGLGAAGHNAFGDAQSHATDVIYSVPSARAAVPGLSSRWIAVGTGEGGAAVVAVAEEEHELRDANYLGSVAISALDDPENRYPPSNAATFYDMPLFLAADIKAVFSDFDPKEILSDKALPLYSLIEQSCGEPARQSKMSASEMLHPNWASNKFVRQYFRRNTLGQKPAQAPILIIAGQLNPTIPTRTTAQVVARMCKQGDQVRLENYPQSGAATVFGDAVRDQISWIQARFAGKPEESNCAEQR